MKNLSGRLAEYKSLAEELEAKRRSLKSEFQKSMIDEIIPRVNQLLPDGLSVNGSESNVCDAYHLTNGKYPMPDYNTTPIGFELSLELLCDGQPIRAFEKRGSLTPDIGELQKLLKQDLEDISKEYGLMGIQVYGEPEEIG